MRLPFCEQEPGSRFEVIRTPDNQIYVHYRMKGTVLVVRLEFIDGRWQIPNRGLEDLNDEMQVLLNEFRVAIESEVNRLHPNGPEGSN